eukprot:scaffold121202_cov39-Tisochrysis_lutea.AAC.1
MTAAERGSGWKKRAALQTTFGERSCDSSKYTAIGSRAQSHSKRRCAWKVFPSINTSPCEERRLMLSA